MQEIKGYEDKNFDDKECSIHSVSDFLAKIDRLSHEWVTPKDQLLGSIWFRGNSTVHDELLPGVYRREYVNRALKSYPYDNNHNESVKILWLERITLKEFRTLGAPYFDANNFIEVYFTAQHFGLKTRLLDWTTNPLAALFFAVERKKEENGELFAMDPKGILPNWPKGTSPDVGVWDQIPMRHPYVSDGIKPSFWEKMKNKDRKPIILPLVPDNSPGRIGQQSSRFTLHMHKSEDCVNERIAKFVVPNSKKPSIEEELRLLNINHFTIYSDLENLSKVIKRSRENLENQSNSRENRPLIAGQGWSDGRQAAGFWRLRAEHGEKADQTGEISL